LISDVLCEMEKKKGLNVGFNLRSLTNDDVA